MKDETLGLLSADPDFEGSLVGGLESHGGKVTLRIDPDGGSLESALVLARRVAGDLARTDVAGRAAAEQQLLVTYNENWRIYERMGEDRKISRISDPELRPAEFRARLRLRHIEILGEESYDLTYDAGSLFAGHSVVVSVSADSGQPYVHLFG